MAIVRTALGTGQDKTAAITLTIGNVVAAGDQLIAILAGDVVNTTIVQYKPSSGAAAENFGETDVTALNSGNVGVSIFRLSNPTPSTDGTALITTSGGTGNARALVVIKVSGLADSPFDKSASSTGSSLAATSTATATLSQADEICIGGIGWEGPVEDNDGTWQNSFNAGQQDGTTGGGAASNITVNEGYLIVSATTAQTAALTRTSNSRDWAAAIATYKGAASATPLTQTAADTLNVPWAEAATVAYGFGLKPTDDGNNFADAVLKIFGYCKDLGEDANNLSDAVSKIFGYLISKSDDSNNLSDSAAVALGFVELFSDTIAQTDALLTILFAQLTQTAADDLNTPWADQLDKLLGFGKSFSDDANNLSDDILLQLAYLIQKSDTLTLTDAQQLQLGHLLSFADQASQTDDIRLQLGYLVAFTDFLTQNDEIASLLGSILSFSDTLSQTDSTSLLYGQLINFGEQFTITDSFGQWVGNLISFSESLEQSDSLSNFLGHLIQLSDLLSQNDELRLQFGYLLNNLNDALEQSDSFLYDLAVVGGAGNLPLVFSDLISQNDSLRLLLTYLLQLSDDLNNYGDSKQTNVAVFVAGLFTLGDIVDRIRQTIDNPVYWTPEDINASVQDGYDEIIGTTGSLLKATIIPFTKDLVYYDLRSIIPDYLAITSIYNPITKRWMTPISLWGLDAIREDWEIIGGTPEYFSVVSHRYVAIHPRTNVDNYGNMYVMYKASAQALTSDSAIKFNNDFITALEEYAAADLLEQNQEFTKASIRFKEYLRLLGQLDTWTKNLRESDRIPTLRDN